MLSINNSTALGFKLNPYQYDGIYDTAYSEIDKQLQFAFFLKHGKFISPFTANVCTTDTDLHTVGICSKKHPSNYYARKDYVHGPIIGNFNNVTYTAAYQLDYYFFGSTPSDYPTPVPDDWNNTFHYFTHYKRNQSLYSDSGNKYNCFTIYDDSTYKKKTAKLYYGVIVRSKNKIDDSNSDLHKICIKGIANPTSTDYTPYLTPTENNRLQTVDVTQALKSNALTAFTLNSSTTNYPYRYYYTGDVTINNSTDIAKFAVAQPLLFINNSNNSDAYKNYFIESNYLYFSM